MYPPKHHQNNDRASIIEVIKSYPLATVISVKDNEPFITHLPLIYDNDKLIGHIDKNNPQTQLLKDNNNVTIIFNGPGCYISPSIFESTQLPTWNYIKIHLKGKVITNPDKKALKQSLISMTGFLEAPDHKYILKANNPQIDKNLDYIVMFEISILHWEGKFKLSQDKKSDDIIKAHEELIRANQTSIKQFLHKIL